MDSTLTIKITTRDGTVIEIVTEVDAATDLLDAVSQHGCRDPATFRFYPPDLIQTIEVMPPPEPVEFSIN